MCMQEFQTRSMLLISTTLRTEKKAIGIPWNEQGELTTVKSLMEYDTTNEAVIPEKVVVE
mgnify:CR=1 FL=1